MVLQDPIPGSAGIFKLSSHHFKNSFLAATLPITSTGFWDRKPRRTPGRLWWIFFGKFFQVLTQGQGEFGKRHPLRTICPRDLPLSVEAPVLVSR